MQRLSDLGSSLSVKIYPNELFVSIAGTVGKPCISAIKACIHDGFVYFPKLNIPPTFLYRIFEAGTCYGGLGKFGTQLNLNTDTIGSIRIAVPPKSEIDNIITFLDSETAKLDNLIAKQEKLLEFIDERIIATVMLAMSSSETQFIRLKFSCEVIIRPVNQAINDSFIRLGVLNRGRGLFKREETDSDDMGDSDFYWIRSGDLILSGQFAWEGSVAMAEDEHDGCVVSHRFPVVRGKADVALTEYLYALLISPHGDFLLNENSRGSAGRNRPLNMNLLLKEKIPIPTMKVQEEIAKLVTLRRKLIKKSQLSIEFVKEHRTALISAAVTGKIDVRDVV